MDLIAAFARRSEFEKARALLAGLQLPYVVSDNVGAVEIPITAVARLDPLKEVAVGPSSSAPDATGKPAAPTTQTPAPAGGAATP